MLAYVFWHAPRSAVTASAYAASLGSFHAALAADPPAGLIASFTTRTARLPWLDAENAYEDWYLLTSSAGLDPLDLAAVDGRRRAAHDRASGEARIGMGGLYRLVRGAPIVPTTTGWYAKPQGWSYADFAPVLDALAAAGATVWQRQMVLGPAPEFAAQTAAWAAADALGVAAVIAIAHTPVAAARIAP